jgi:hypothetical protein
MVWFIWIRYLDKFRVLEMMKTSKRWKNKRIRNGKKKLAR